MNNLTIAELTDVNRGKVVEVQLFGPFSVVVEGRPSGQVSKSCQQLFALMLVEGEMGLDRDFAAQTLWPETPLASARFYFRRTLSECRKALGPFKGALISIQPNHVRFDSSVGSDLHHFEKLAESDEVGCLFEALEISEKEFLPAIRTTWRNTERLKLQLKARGAYLKCARLLKGAGDFSGALVVLSRALAADPLDDEVIVPYWEALIETGQEREFRETHRRILERYLKAGLEITPRMAAFSKRFFGKEDTFQESDRHDWELVNTPIALEDSGAFLGRKAELNRLISLLKANRLVEINGAPGAGKTRLALELAKQLRWPSAYTTTGNLTTDQIPRGRKFLLIVDCLDPSSEAILEALQGFPYLRVLRVSSGLPIGDSSALLRLKSLEPDVAKGMLNSLLEGRGSGNDAISEICRRLDGNPLALKVAASHCNLVGAEETLQRLVDPRTSDAPLSEILRCVGDPWLSYLEPAELGALGAICEIEGTFSISLARYVISSFSVEQPDTFISQKLLGLRMLTRKESGRLSASELLRLCIRQRVQTTKGTAVFSDYFLQISPSLEEEDISIVEQAIDFLAEAQSEDALALLNLIGPYLIEQGLDKRLAAQTDRVLKKCLPSKQVIQALFNLGSVFHRTHQLNHAAQAFRDAASLADQMAMRTEKMLSLLCLGEVESNSAELEASKTHLVEALAMARAASDRSSEALALRNLGYAERLALNYEVAVNYTTKALAIYTLLGDQDGRVWCFGSLASCYLESKCYEQARAGFTEALAIHRSNNNVPGICWNVTYLAETSNHLGELEVGEQFIVEALSMTEGPENFHRRAWPLRVYAENLILQGKFRQAEKCLTESLDALRDSGNRKGEAHALIRLAQVAEGGCEGSVGRAYLELAEEIGKSLNSARILDEVRRVVKDNQPVSIF